MSRILSLQQMEVAGSEFAGDEVTEASSCSYAICGHCSSNSESSCALNPLFIAI